MLTIFSIPKPFRGHIGTIQRNAITSWTLLRPRAEIILFGNEEGTAHVAQELGLRHLPGIASNEYGTPLLNDLISQAEHNASYDTMCYVNADILVLSDFSTAVAQVKEKLKNSLIVSERINLDVTEPLGFDDDWEASIRERSQKGGVLAGHAWIDVFVFPKGMYPQVPDFGIGRCWFDQWLIKAARESGVPVVDVSRVAPLIHQNHDYNHVSGGYDTVWRGKETEHNFRLYGGVVNAYTLLDATHKFMPGARLLRVWLRRPWFDAKMLAWDLFVQRTVKLRDALKLRRKYWVPRHRRNV